MKSIIEARRAAELPPRPRNLSALRRLAGQQPLPEPAGELLERNTFVFASVEPFKPLDHRIEDADGITIGWALQLPRRDFTGAGRSWHSAGDGARPGRLSQVRVEISDHERGRLFELLRPRGFLAVPPVSVLEHGALVGSLWRTGRRRTTIFDKSGLQLATIQRDSRGYSVHYAIHNLAGIELGTLSDYRHIAERTLVEPQQRRMLRRLFGASQPSEHVLEITAPVGKELRILMLAAAASLYLELQYPETAGDD